MKRLVISRDYLETRVALLEDEKVAELYVEQRGRPSLVGNIYKGRVENVLAGMDAAFVDIGLERNGFLCFEDARALRQRGRSGKGIAGLLQAGKEALVQVSRDPMGGKGPRVTTQLALAGRCLVFLPRTTAAGVSRRLTDDERERLRGVSEGLDRGTGAGLIIRTAAEGADQQAIARELRFLQRQWGCVERRVAACSAPALVHAEAELAVRAVRDLMGPEFGTVVVDDSGVRRRLASYLRAIAPELAGEVELDDSGELFERFGLEGQIKKALARRVDLPSGGYLVIDYTEAMTVIDVNTGSYTGRRFLEETTLKTNLEACREVVRQLRLRDIGGIIVIDFIDMAAPSNREAVLKALQAELAKDRTKSYVVEISPLGLVEMTRQNVTPGLREVVTVPCPECRGGGRGLSEDSALAEVGRRIRRAARASQLPGISVEVHPRIAARLRAEPAGAAATGPKRAGSTAPGYGAAAPGLTLLHQIEAETGKHVSVQAAGEGVVLGHFEIVPD